MISAILLAAGESRRMGEFKQLLRLDGKSFVEHCVDNLLASRIDEVIVVTGHRNLDICAALGDRPVRFVHNTKYRSGMATSIQCGFQALSDSSRACLLALVDQPQISADVMNRLIETYEATKAPIVIPTYDGQNGHPILIDVGLKKQIIEMDQEQGLRQVVRQNFDYVRRVPMSSRVVL